MYPLEVIRRRWLLLLRRSGYAAPTTTLTHLMHMGLLAQRARAWAVPLHGVPPPPLPTILASGFRSWWVTGGAAGAGRYFDAHDAAVCLGTVRSAAWPHALRLLSPRQLWRAVGNSTDATFVTSVVRAALRACSPLPATPRYGALYAGLDTFLDAFREELGAVRAVCAAEKLPHLRKVLRARMAYERLYDDVADAAADLRCQLDVLVCTPPCPPVSSSAAASGRRSRSARRAHACRATRRVGDLLAAVMHRTTPRLVIIEQVTGLLTHHPSVLRELWRALDALPYVFHMSPVDAVALRGRSRRMRLAIILVRADCATVRPPHRAVGRLGVCACCRRVLAWCTCRATHRA